MSVLGSGRPYLGEAQGDVTVPTDRDVKLAVFAALAPEDLARLRWRDPRTHEFVTVNQLRTGPYDLSCLSGLEPNDLHTLTLGSPGSQGGRFRPAFPRTHCAPDGIAHSIPVQHERDRQGLGVSSGTCGISRRSHSRVRCWSRTTDWPCSRICLRWSLWISIPAQRTSVSSTSRRFRICGGCGYAPAGFGGQVWAELAHASRLERLCLWGQSRFTDRQVAYLEGLTQLKSLTIWGIGDQLTDASLASIAKLENLEEMYFIRTTPRFTAAGLAHLHRLKKLRTAAFGHAWVCNEGMTHGDEIARQLAAMPQLEVVEGVCYLSAEGVAMLARLPRLRCLQMGLRGPSTEL